MSKIKKAMERSKARRGGNFDATALSKREQLEQSRARRGESLDTTALTERELLERDIKKLLRDEHPDELDSMKKQIKLSYSKTRTIKTDLNTLKSNRVYALTHNIEITKQIEILRAQVLKRLKQTNANSLMITSAGHQEGKTFISANLAVSISQSLDRTVMLIDADLRKRSYNSQNMEKVFFNSNDLTGLSDYLSGKANVEELLVNPGIPRLTILPSGNAQPDAAALLGSPKMEELISEMKSKYSTERVLIFDCSSFLSYADPYVLSKYVDAVLLVVENERTDVKSLGRMLKLLKDNKIVGTVLNKSA